VEGATAPPVENKTMQMVLNGDKTLDHDSSLFIYCSILPGYYFCNTGELLFLLIDMRSIDEWSEILYVYFWY
jgi:hypothetical protein